MHYHYIKRRLVNYLAILLACIALSLGLFWLFWVLFSLVKYGISGISWHAILHNTKPPGSGGGLCNAIVGSFLMVFFATLIGAPIGLLIGLYLTEYGKSLRLKKAIQFVNDILLSAPSIVLGLFIYQIYVVPMGHFSGWAGSFALSLLVIPIVVRTTEDIFALVPSNLREAAFALGAPRWKVILYVILPVSRTGVITGILLAVARISGETAPLLFTALNSQFFSLDMNRPMANLPSVIFQYAMGPYKDWNQLAWSGALLITLFVLSLNMIVRIVSRHKNTVY